MIYFANGLRIYVAIVLLIVGGLTYSVLKPYWRRAFQRGSSYSRHVVKVSMSHIGTFLILAQDNLLEFNDISNFSLFFFVLFSTLTLSSLIDLIRARRDAE